MDVDRPTITFILPAYNEQENITDAIHSVVKVAERVASDYEVIVVDDGSCDDTSAIAQAESVENPRVRVLGHGRNRGYGEALRTGFLSARKDLVFFTDADNQFDLEELDHFLPWIEHVDVVAGYRINRQDPPMRRMMAAGWNGLVRILFYVPVRDIDCAFKLFRRSVLERIDLESVGAMVSTELMVKLGRSGASVIEVGVTHYPRTAGEARGANPRVIARALSELVRMYGRLNTSGSERAHTPHPLPR